MALVVLPFRNASGDPSLNAWRHGFAESLGHRLAWAQRVDQPDWDTFSSALTNAGWSLGSALDAKLAKRIARDLQLDAVIAGEYSRASGEWVLRIQVFHPGSTNPPGNVQVKGTSLSDLLVGASLALAEHLGTKVTPAVVELWRKHGTTSEAALSCLAEATTLERQGASLSKQEKALRRALKLDDQSLSARSELVRVLAQARNFTKATAESRKLLSEAPDVCNGHMALMATASRKDAKGAEIEAREALRVHPGCPGACSGLFRLWHDTNRWPEFRAILEKAATDLPDQTSTRAYLALARLRCGDREGSRQLLREIGDTARWETTEVHIALLEALLENGQVLGAARELRWFQQQAPKNPFVADLLAAADRTSYLKIPKPLTNALTRPGRFTPEQLQSELHRRLTPEEYPLAQNPVELTPALCALSTNLTRGLTNKVLKAFVLFQEVVQRGGGEGKAGSRTAQQALQSSQDSPTRFSCQEYAKLFVALARAAGLEAWLVHVDICEDGRVGWHDCAALFLPDQAFLVDPTWHAFVIDHQQFRVLDDLQAIAHQAMQLGDKPSSSRLRLGVKLDPDDAWTRLKLVRGLAMAGLTDEAAAELARLGTNAASSWDFYHASAAVQMSRQRWQAALASLQQALSLSPSNALVHLSLANVYNELKDYTKSREHAEMAGRLDVGNAFDLNSDKNRFDLKLLGAMEQTQSRSPEARQVLLRRAETGDAAAQLALAKLCFDAKPPQPEEGMRWMRLAAEQGDQDIQLQYAQNLLLFRTKAAGVEAMEFFAGSAKQGNPTAQFHLGLLLYEGKVVPRDQVAACQWVMLAADGGLREANNLLKEMELFLSQSQLAEGRKRALEFKPRDANATRVKQGS